MAVAARIGSVLAALLVLACPVPAQIGQWRLANVSSAGPLPALGRPASYGTLGDARSLSEQQAQTLENTLQSSPDELRTRILLLGYYANREAPLHDAAAGAARWRHLKWLIENRP